ncbi:MAG: hypothetical protein ABGX07_18355, partial [Pirellulaceae bacterium]
ELLYQMLKLLPILSLVTSLGLPVTPKLLRFPINPSQSCLSREQVARGLWSDDGCTVPQRVTESSHFRSNVGSTADMDKVQERKRMGLQFHD